MIANRVQRLLVAAGAVLVLASCSSDPHGSATASSSAPKPDASSSPSAGPAQQDRPDIAKVITAGGVTQYLKCAGNGPQTVVIVPGLGTGVAAWTKVFRQVSLQTRTCVYDRPGIGRSPTRTGSTSLDAGQHAQELRALLDKAGERAPFVPVGHSYGGLVARAFVHQHKPDIAGLLLAESVTPNDPYNGSSWPEGGTSIDLAASSRATGGGPKLGATPLVVLSASNPEGDHLGGPTYGFSDAVTEQWIRGQLDDVRLSSDSIRVVAKSGHVLQQDNSAATVHSIDVLIDAINTKSPLTCGSGWRSFNATCTGGAK
ncbi:MAG: alpha/beta fold hydrolase [Candidatus Nanopelagicales bacterium]